MSNVLRSLFSKSKVLILMSQMSRNVSVKQASFVKVPNDLCSTGCIRLNLNVVQNYHSPNDKAADEKDAMNGNNEDMVDYETLYYRKDAEFKKELDTRIRAQVKLEQTYGVVGAVMSRRALDKFVVMYVKRYFTEKAPGTKYTGADFKRAYILFLKDDSEVSAAVKQLFPDMTVEEIADLFRQMYGKLSWLDNTLYDALKKTETLDGLNKFISWLPATLSPSEVKNIEKIVSLVLKFDTEYDNYEIPYLCSHIF